MATGWCVPCPARRRARRTAAPAVTRRSTRVPRTSWSGRRMRASNRGGTGIRCAGSGACSAVPADRLTSPRGSMAQLIRAATVLPARRTPITFATEDGLNLVGELALPQDRDPAATLVCLHPLPTQGGMMDSHVLRKASYRLPALADVAVVRFNTRGTQSERGRSDGEFGGGETERYDVAAAVRYAADAGLPNIWLLGWSFGTELTLRWGLLPGVVGGILLSPPLRRPTHP